MTIIQKILNLICPEPISNLVAAVGIICKHGVYNVGDTDPYRDSCFNIGDKYVLQFGDHSKICQLKMKGDDVPLYIFEGNNVGIIRQVVINVHSDAVSKF